jgi:ArsR family transcriptional regulator, lead/cadmium/zinc/bismuth-responsive transcriptional repressor
MAQPAVLPPIDPEALAAARSALPPEELLDIVVQTFAALGDPTRARILYALGRRSLCVRDLALLVGVSESAVSHQLRLLRERGLVRSRREGNVVYYALHDPHLGVLFREAEYHAGHLRQDQPYHPYP